MERRFLIDKLPLEILHAICAHLKPTEVANLRLLSRAAALVGLQYLVPEVRLILTEESFNQLRAIAEHPVVAKNVTSFLYDADRVQDCDRVEWKRTVLSPDFKAQIQELQTRGLCHCDSERKQRTFARDIAKLKAMPRHQNYERGLNMDFLRYHGFCALHFEDQLDCHSAEIASAMQRFVNLKKVCLLTDPGTRPHICADEEALRPSYAYPSNSDGQNQTLGVLQMFALLRGMERASSKIENLDCGILSWRFLEADDDIFAKARGSLSSLRKLSIAIIVIEGYFEIKLDCEAGLRWCQDEKARCAKTLRKGRLQDLLASSPLLEDLDISLPAYKWNGLNLQHSIGDFRWTSLKRVTFREAFTEANDLVDFCGRHASTLKHLRLENPGRSTNDWWTVWEGLHQNPELQLDTMEFHPISYIEHRGISDHHKKGIAAYLTDASVPRDMPLDDFFRSMWLMAPQP